MFRFPIHPMILIALKEANRVAKTSVDRRYHTLIQQRPGLFVGTDARVSRMASMATSCP
jgi:hypothetical protein